MLTDKQKKLVIVIGLISFWEAVATYYLIQKWRYRHQPQHRFLIDEMLHSTKNFLAAKIIKMIR